MTKLILIEPTPFGVMEFIFKHKNYTMSTIKQQKLFYKNALELILKVGAKKSNERSDFKNDYTLETKAGKLTISLPKPERSEICLFTIFCHFDSENKAKAAITNERLNRFSGKWNFHSFNALELLQNFETEIKPILLNS